MHEVHRAFRRLQWQVDEPGREAGKRKSKKGSFEYLCPPKSFSFGGRRTDQGQLEESWVAAEYRTSDCRGCKRRFLSPSLDLRPPKGSLGPPGLSLAFVSAA